MILKWNELLQISVCVCHTNSSITYVDRDDRDNVTQSHVCKKYEPLVILTWEFLFTFLTFMIHTYTHNSCVSKFSTVIIINFCYNKREKKLEGNLFITSCKETYISNNFFNFYTSYMHSKGEFDWGNKIYNVFLSKCYI